MFKIRFLILLCCFSLIQGISWADYTFSTVTPIQQTTINPYYPPVNQGYYQNPYGYNRYPYNYYPPTTADGAPYYTTNPYYNNYNTGLKNQIVRNVGKQLIYSMMNR